MVLYMKILLIEDNEVDHFIAAQTIEKHFENVTLDWAMNGQEALNILEKSQYDFIFLDLNMPIMNGLEFLKRYDEMYPERECLIYPLTSSKDNKDIVKCLSYKYVQDYIRKARWNSKLLEILSIKQDSKSHLT